MLNLRPRLRTAAEMVKSGRKTVDIGTDHAYLPAWLVLNGICESVLACDIGVKPLENAAATIKTYGLEDKISLRVSDGLENVLPSEAQEITVCGMGGTLIAEILERAEWIRNNNVHLVLQPMTHSEDVREYLCKNGFSITEERCIRDTGRVYCCISAEFTGWRPEAENGYFYFGGISADTPEEREYIRKQITRVRKRADALREVSRYPEEEAMLREVIKYYGEHFDDNGI